MNSVSAPKIPLDAFDSSRCSVPYPWPVAGRWRADDTALLAIDMQKDFLDPRGYFAASVNRWNTPGAAWRRPATPSRRPGNWA